MDDTSIFISHPRNGADIMRSQTTNMRIWDIPRTVQAISIFQHEISQGQYPSIYILFEGQRKVYIGETENISGRISEHHNNPQQYIIRWNKGLIINDGRSARFSDFNDTAVRHSLEYYVKSLFQYNGYHVISQARDQQLTAYQLSILNYLKNELNIIFIRLNLIQRLIDKPEEREIFDDELRELLIQRGKRIVEWSAFFAKIDGEKYYIRAGSKKAKGWQITSRGRKSGSFIDAVIQGEGYLLVRRGKVLIIPLEFIKRITNIENDDERDTFDIFISFEDSRIFLKYHDQSIEITDYRLLE